MIDDAIGLVARRALHGADLVNDLAFVGEVPGLLPGGRFLAAPGLPGGRSRSRPLLGQCVPDLCVITGIRMRPGARWHEALAEFEDLGRWDVRILWTGCVPPSSIFA